MLTSLKRTLVPLVVAYAVTSLLKLGVEIDDASLTLVLNGLVTGIYYGAVRWLEENVAPRFGWLLGAAKAPSYEE